MSSAWLMPVMPAIAGMSSAAAAVVPEPPRWASPAAAAPTDAASEERAFRLENPAMATHLLRVTFLLGPKCAFSAL